MSDNDSYVWYLGYGSNLSKQRFLCYIIGGKSKYGEKKNKGYSDKTLPKEDKPFKIPYSLYFALPNGITKTENWGKGGVAFIYPFPDKDESDWSSGRIWKITKEQYKEVRDQEGEWYNCEIPLGYENGIPIYTLTSEKNLSNILQPSGAYLKTIALGLRETYSLSNEKIARYLVKKNCVKGNLNTDELIKIIQSATRAK